MSCVPAFLPPSWLRARHLPYERGHEAERRQALVESDVVELRDDASEGGRGGAGAAADRVVARMNDKSHSTAQHYTAPHGSGSQL